MPTQAEINLRAFLDAFGEDLLAAFGRCFIHADRLTSLLDFVLLSERAHGEDSTAHERNLDTMAWFACGTLWEAAAAVEDLERAGLAARLGDTHDWDELLALVRDWRADPMVRVRNNIAFHVDPKLVARGLRKLASEPGPTRLASLGTNQLEDRLILGLEALLAGVGLDKDQILSVLKATRAGHFAFSRLVQQLFTTVASRAGLSVERGAD